MLHRANFTAFLLYRMSMKSSGQNFKGGIFGTEHLEHVMLHNTAKVKNRCISSKRTQQSQCRRPPNVIKGVGNKKKTPVNINE
jgi:hypothetical protein